MKKNKERNTDATAEAAKEFLDQIADLMGRLDINPGLAFSLFGYFARHVIEFEVDENGANGDQLTLAALQGFASGLGVKGGFVEMRGEMAAQLKAQVERQHDDKPLQ